MKKYFPNIMRGIAVSACIILCIFAYIIYGNTIISLHTSIIIPLFLAAVSAPFLYRKWSRLTTSDNKYFNGICHILIAGSILYSAFMLCNYYMADADSAYKEEALLKEKKTFKRRKTRYVGRRRYATNAGYRYEYCLYLALPDSSVKEVNVRHEVYNMARNGYPVTLVMEKGLFGYPVIKEITVKKHETGGSFGRKTPRHKWRREHFQ